jgi:hypothetical protein
VIEIKIDVKFDPDKIGDELRKRVAQGMTDLARAAHQAWDREAATQLRTTRRRYRDALKIREIDDFTKQIYLRNETEEDFLVNALEGGYPPYSVYEPMFRKKNPKLYRWSECAKPPLTSAKKENPPFIDIPRRTKKYMSWERCTKPDASPPFIRITNANKSMKHPGFKPLGSGGLDRPLREFAIDHIEKEAQNVFDAVFEGLI